MKILMEVLFFVFDKNAPYLKKLILPKAIKADQKYNCCCEGTCFDICFCLEQRSKPSYWNFLPNGKLKGQKF